MLDNNGSVLSLPRFTGADLVLVWHRSGRFAHIVGCLMYRSMIL